MSTVLIHPLLNKDVEKLKVKNVALTKEPDFLCI